MKALVSFELPESGGTVIAEVDTDDPGYERVARSDEIVAAAGMRFDTALDVIRPTAAALLDKVRALAKPPEEVTVEFGLKLNFKAGAVIASSQAETHIQVTLKWTNPTSPAGSPASAAAPAG